MMCYITIAVTLSIALQCMNGMEIKHRARTILLCMNLLYLENGMLAML